MNGIPTRGGKRPTIPMKPNQNFSVELKKPSDMTDEEWAAVLSRTARLVYEDIRRCQHAWRVYSTAVGVPAVMVECTGCNSTGLVLAFDDSLWARAFHASREPFDLPPGYVVREIRPR